MNTKHIPGPWRVLALGGATYEVESHTHTESRGIDCNGMPCQWSDHTEATARLIAAAPELLEALYMTRRQLAKLSFKDGEISAAIEAAYRAIAKATGSAA